MGMSYAEVKKWRQKNPCYNSLDAARQRCSNPKHRSYPWYGARGIKCLLSFEDAKALWIRDEAHKLRRPSLDRIDTRRGYDLENCRFIELVENISLGSRARRQYAAA